MTLGWGTVRLGRTALQERFTVTEQGGDRSLDLDGQESSPPLTRAALITAHDNINALTGGTPTAVTFTDKPERNGYYQVKSSSSTLVEYVGDMLSAEWKVSMDRLGSEGEVDLQSRLTGAARLNDYFLTGERWQAPPVGHWGYYTGATSPSTMVRTGQDGPITVYRSIPPGVAPRWGCAPEDYLAGRVRISSTAGEMEGTDRPLPPGDWSLGNALVNVTPTVSAGVLDVQAYTGGAWHSKLYTVSLGGAPLAGWDSASILRNDLEHCVVRLTASRSPGRVTLDLTLRRGSRFVEGYLQSGAAGTLAVYRQTLEVNTSVAASGYVVASGNDANGNRFCVGSARTFTAHANGGVSKTSAASLDFWIGVQAGGGTPASGDAATDLRAQYIGALSEATYAVRR